MGRARLAISPDVFVEALKVDGVRTLDVTAFGLPADARLVDVAYICSGRVVVLELESAAYNEIGDDATPPLLPTPQIVVVRPADELNDNTFRE
jgi:hypothetical protein